LNTVGKYGRLGGSIRCLVPVAMLTERWDANTARTYLESEPRARGMLGSTAGGNLSWYSPCIGDFRYSQIVRRLQVYPGARIAAEIARQTHRRISRDPTPFTNNVVTARCGHVECLGQLHWHS
jgi:hypothetical protein